MEISTHSPCSHTHRGLLWSSYFWTLFCNLKQTLPSDRVILHLVIDTHHTHDLSPASCRLGLSISCSAGPKQMNGADVTDCLFRFSGQGHWTTRPTHFTDLLTHNGHSFYRLAASHETRSGQPLKIRANFVLHFVLYLPPNSLVLNITI
jgi:hypothetical protein